MINLFVYLLLMLVMGSVTYCLSQCWFTFLYIHGLCGLHFETAMVWVLFFFIKAGDVPCDNSLLRQVSSLVRRLPAIESGKFQDDFLMVSVFLCSLPLNWMSCLFSFPFFSLYFLFVKNGKMKKKMEKLLSAFATVKN